MSVFQDLRIMSRSLRTSRGLALAVASTFGLGIGCVTAVAAYASALLLRPLPFPEPGQLIRVQPVRSGVAGAISALEVRDIAGQARLLTGVASFKPAQLTSTGNGHPEVAVASFNSYNLFEILGARPILGRTWDATDDGTRAFTVVVSHDFWLRRLGADPAIVGKSILLDAYAYTVIGVLPPGFNFPTRADVYRRVSAQDLASRSVRTASAIARMAPGVTLAQAQAELDAIAARLARDFPDTNAETSFTARPLREYWIGSASGFFGFLFAAVGSVLIVTCINVAGLLLARSATRDHEVALKIALGARRSAILRAAAVEALVLAAVGAMGGMLMARWLVHGLDSLIRIERPAWMDLAMDWRVLLASTAAATVSGLVAGLIPALHASRLAPADALRDAGRPASGGASRRRLLRRIVVMQVALAVAMVAAAGLMTTTLRNLAAIDLGFDADRLLTLRVDPPWSRYDRVEATKAFYRRVLEEVATVPGVSQVALNDAPPIIGVGGGDGAHKNLPVIEGQTAEDRERTPFVNLQVVSPRYFEVMRIPMLQGRGIESSDRDLETPVAVVSERLARRFWPRGDAINKRLQVGQLGASYNYGRSWTDSIPRWATIVGIAADVKHDAMGEAGLDVYLPIEQYFVPGAYLMLRAEGAHAAVLDAVRAAVWKVDADVAVFDVATMRQRLDDVFWQRRLSQALLSALGTVAFFLALIGVYGVTSLAIAQRRTELGVRLALGARGGQVMRLILADACRMAGLGVGVGLLLAFGAARLMRALLYDVSALNAPALYGAAAAMAAATIAASCIPAVRAGRTDPASAMRE